MFLKIYSIEDTQTNIKYPNTYILRFSGIDTKTGYFKNGNKQGCDIKKADLINHDDMEKKIQKNSKLFKYLIENLECNKDCYPINFNPWDKYIDTDYILPPNQECIIVFNTLTNNVLGYCKLNYAEHNDDIIYYTALEIESLISLKSKPNEKENKYIGAVILFFIKQTYVNIYIAITKIVQGQSFNDDVKIQCKNIDIIYLYSLTDAISYYEKIDFLYTYEIAIDKIYKYHGLDNPNTKELEPIFKHLFIYMPDLDTRDIKKFNAIFYGIFNKDAGEVEKVIQDEKSLDIFKAFKIKQLNQSCYNNKKIDKDNDKTINENITNKEKFKIESIIFKKDTEKRLTRLNNLFRKMTDKLSDSSSKRQRHK
jgi:hypothetical protein